MITSQKRIGSWKVAANTFGSRLVYLLPVFNEREVLPHPSIEDALNEEPAYCRTNLPLCVVV